MNAGQVCLAGTRVIVESSIEQEFLEKVRAVVSQISVGDPANPKTRMGPLIHPEHYARVSGFVERAKAAGAEVLWGGQQDDAGQLFFQPTMFAGVKKDAEIMQREVFGPVLTWQTFDTDDEVVAIANGTEYGLAGTLFCGNEKRAMGIASKVVAGTLWVNCYFVRELAAPFGGSRASGYGREGGSWSFDFFCDIKNVAVRRNSFTS